MNNTFSRVLSQLKPYKWRIFFALLLETAVVILNDFYPRITTRVVNEVITDGNYGLLKILCIEMIAIAAIRSIGMFVRSVLLQKTGQKVNLDLRNGIYRHLSELPWEFYDKNRVGEIMSRMTGDLANMRNFYANVINQIYSNVLCFVSAFVFMVFMSWQVTLMVLVMAPIIAVTAWKFRKTIGPVFRSVREQNAVLNTRTQENLAGMHVVKAFAREDYEEVNFKKDNRDLLEKNLRASWIWSSYMPLMDIMSSLCTPIALIGGALMVKAGTMDIGTLIGVTGYIWMLTNPMRQVASIINTASQAVTSAEKVFYYVDIGSGLKDPEHPTVPEKYEGHVVFDHVTFHYGDTKVLDDICLEAKPGETIAVMGATGEGKTTLVNLLARFYDVSAGRVLIDGVDVRRQPMKTLRSHIGFVPQDTFLFSDTINDNIRYGKPNADFETVQKSADVAEAAEFIKKCPDGYETVVGERGMGLSGGQRQRTAIARAVLIDPAILVLDDSTSAVDMETEYEIQQKLKEVLAGRTTFVIAHRISSVKNADQIIVLKDGHIAERGKHSELIKLGGIYAGMVADQMSSAVKV